MHRKHKQINRVLDLQDMKIAIIILTTIVLVGCSYLEVSPTAKEGYASITIDSKTTRILSIKESNHSSKEEYYYPNYPQKIYLKPGRFSFHIQCSRNEFKSYILITSHMVPVPIYSRLTIPEAKNYKLSCLAAINNSEDDVYKLDEI